MLATRFITFGTALNLPDASMAVLFLGGLYLRRHAMFVAFVALAVVVDRISIDYAGVSRFCVTPAYAFLLPAYAVLWYSARAYADRLQPTPAAMSLALGIALACTAASFAISNGAFYWLGGRYENPHLSEYLARLWQWGTVVRAYDPWLHRGRARAAFAAGVDGAQAYPGAHDLIRSESDRSPPCHLVIYLSHPQARSSSSASRSRCR